MWYACVCSMAACVLVMNVAMGHQFRPGGQGGRDKRLAELLYGHFGSGYHCRHNGRYISHGHVYKTSRCLKSMCFLGTSFLQSEGCEDAMGKCHRVNSLWTKTCVTYKCRKTTKGGYNYYQPVVAEAQCRDVHGLCHAPGEIFSVELNGTRHDRCLCNIRHNMIYYRCVLHSNA